MADQLDQDLTKAKALNQELKRLLQETESFQGDQQQFEQTNISDAQQDDGYSDDFEGSPKIQTPAGEQQENLKDCENQIEPQIDSEQVDGPQTNYQDYTDVVKENAGVDSVLQSKKLANQEQNSARAQQDHKFTVKSNTNKLNTLKNKAQDQKLNEAKQQPKVQRQAVQNNTNQGSTKQLQQSPQPKQESQKTILPQIEQSQRQVANKNKKILTFSQSPNRTQAKPHQKISYSHTNYAAQEIERENINLVKRITAVALKGSKDMATLQGKGGLGNKREKRPFHAEATRLRREREIQAQNAKIYERLQKVKPSKQITRTELQKFLVQQDQYKNLRRVIPQAKERPNRQI